MIVESKSKDDLLVASFELKKKSSIMIQNTPLEVYLPRVRIAKETPRKLKPLVLDVSMSNLSKLNKSKMSSIVNTPNQPLKSVRSFGKSKMKFSIN